MKIKIIFTILVINLLNVIPNFAQTQYTIDNVPNVRSKDLRHYISDPNQFINEAVQQDINKNLYQLEQKTGVEVAVVTLPSIGSEDCFDFAYNLFTKWKIGKAKKDNGLLILLVVDQRCVQFITGYGLEGILPDIICKQIQVNDMVPFLKNQNWSEGMSAGVSAVYSRLYNNMEDGEVINMPESTNNDKSGLFIIIIFASFFFIFIVIPLLFFLYSKRCPKCKKMKLQRTNSRVLSETANYKLIEYEFQCLNCGNIVKRKTKQYKNNNRNRGGGGGGPIIFGGGGFGGGSGGSFGGSFGGGSSGGGGAGTRF